MIDATSRSITIAGAGILGLWQALTLARTGYRVRVLDDAPEPFGASASRWAGAMLAPDCEAEAAPPVVREQGLGAIELWRAAYSGLAFNGSLVVAAARDRAELKQFAARTRSHQMLDANEVGALEGDLAGRFAAGLYFPHEAHMSPLAAMAHLRAEAERAAVQFAWGSGWDGAPVDGEIVVDCRGWGARRDLPGLRGVRGERLLVRATDVSLARPVRLLHPRHPIYIVPWGDGRFVIGATVIESDDDGPMTVRSALELLGTAYALAPSFGEAEILDLGAGVRPAFPDNVPRAIVEPGGRVIRVNGAYRHGFLLAPVLAAAVAGYLDGRASHPLLETR